MDNDQFINIQKQSNDDFSKIKLNTVVYDKNIKK